MFEVIRCDYHFSFRASIKKNLFNVSKRDCGNILSTYEEVRILVEVERIS